MLYHDGPLYSYPDSNGSIHEGLELCAADYIKAYALSGPLDKACYIVVDDAFR